MSSLDASKLTPEIIEEMYEATAGLSPKRLPYGLVSYDFYIACRYYLEVTVPRRMAERDKEGDDSGRLGKEAVSF